MRITTALRNRQRHAGKGSRPARIVIVGGGYVGMYTALRLRRKLRRHQAEICVIDPKSYMT